MPLRLSTVVAIGLLGLVAQRSSAAPPAANQTVVAGIPEEVFGLAATAAVSPPALGNTIPVDVRRERIGDTIVVTIAPRD
jgi:hypothetical protein